MTEDLLPYAARLRQQALFAVWSPPQLEALLGECRLHACENAELLFIEKDPAEQFYFLDAGVVELLSTSAEGKEKVVEIMQAGDLFAEAVAFMGGRYPVTARCQGKTRVLQIPFSPFVGILEGDPRLMRRILGQLSMRLHFLVKEIRMRSIESADTRICNYLLELSDASEKTDRFQLPAKKVSVAARLGVTPETLSRVLRRLKEAGAIDMRDKTITVLDRRKLLEVGLR
ncbi:Crp/Fnr family transcriptional regulator [Acidithiobacillus sp. AC3]